MKKIFTVLIALMLLAFTQCKPDNGNEGGANGKIKVVCEVPINNKGVSETRSDFEKLTVDGSIMWSTGTERLYLAIPNNGNPQIVELLADEHTVKANVLAFEGEVDEGLLEQNGVYEVWYFGNSKTYLGTPYFSTNKEGDVIKSISGSIATQSGNLSDLGYCHIAKTTVSANIEDGQIVLPLRGILKSEVAIAHLDLDGVTQLNGDAVIGTNYTYSYNSGRGQFEFAVTGGSSINVTDGSATSYVMLLPNATNDVVLESSKGTYTFKNAIEANKFYFRYLDNYEMAPLEWTGGGSGGGGGAGTFSYNFDDGSLSGWRTFTGAGNAGNGWVISPVVPSYYPATYQTIYKGTDGTECIVSISYDMINSSTYKPHAYIVTEEAYPISANSVLTWNVRAPFSSVGEYYEVVVSEDNSTFEAIHSETVSNTDMAPKTLNFADVAADKVGKSLYIGFRHYRASSNSNAAHVCIDDVILSGN